MNAKRQTVWLVSMLSLMVVLSAYYLFTEDVNQLQLTGTSGSQGAQNSVTITDHSNPAAPAQTDTKASAGNTAKSDNKANATKTDAKTDTKTTAKADTTSSTSAGTKSTASTDTKVTTGTDVKAAAAGSNKSTASNQSTADAQVLEKMQNQAKSGSDYFIDLQLKRQDDMAKQTSTLMTIITDSKQNTDAVAKAYDDLRKLEDKEAKLTNLEELLMKDFPQALVSEDSNKFKVTVQSNALERSQAVSIVDKVMKEMNVGADKVVVAYMP